MSQGSTILEEYPNGTKIKVLRKPSNHSDKNLTGEVFETSRLIELRGFQVYTVTPQAAEHYPVLKEMIMSKIKDSQDLYQAGGLEKPDWDKDAIFLFEKDACELIHPSDKTYPLFRELFDPLKRSLDRNQTADINKHKLPGATAGMVLTIYLEPSQLQSVQVEVVKVGPFRTYLKKV